MRAKGIFTATRDGLLPSDKRAVEIMQEIGENKKSLVWVHTARYPEHHRFAFAVLQKIANAIGKPVEIVLLWLKHETGRVDWVRLPDGRTVEEPQSIAFESMDQKQFQEFWNEALEVIKEKMLPHIDKKTYEELRDMISGKVQ